jgi:hypothetical protein
VKRPRDPVRAWFILTGLILGAVVLAAFLGVLIAWVP